MSAERGEKVDLVHEVTRALEITLAEHGIAFEPVDDAERVGRALTANLIARVPSLRTDPTDSPRGEDHQREISERLAQAERQLDGYLNPEGREIGNRHLAEKALTSLRHAMQLRADHPDPSTRSEKCAHKWTQGADHQLGDPIHCDKCGEQLTGDPAPTESENAAVDALVKALADHMDIPWRELRARLWGVETAGDHD